MPRTPRHTLAWSHADGLYVLSGRGRAEQTFRPGDDGPWQTWLGEATSFTFRGASGSLNVRCEARARGGRYWYAYHAAMGQSGKRYLGKATAVSLARLEEVAAGFAPAPSEIPPFSRSGAAADAALPATRLAPPRPSAALVARENLMAELDAAVAAPLTLLAAPAGWGKSTLLAAWASRHPRRVAWLSLEAPDDDPARFWTAVIMALRRCRPGIGALALAMVRAPQAPPPDTVAAALLNELAAAGADGPPLLLVLDDYHLIAAGPIREGMRVFLDHLPAGLRLVIASRVDPDLPLARLRARGQLAELRAADLRFTREEAAAFLQRTIVYPLMADEVEALERRTEGWAAGLQLAALALRAQEDRAAWLARFTGGTATCWTTPGTRSCGHSRTRSGVSCCRSPSCRACAPSSAGR